MVTEADMMLFGLPGIGAADPFHDHIAVVCSARHLSLKGASWALRLLSGPRRHLGQLRYAECHFRLADNFVDSAESAIRQEEGKHCHLYCQAY